MERYRNEVIVDITITLAIVGPRVEYHVCHPIRHERYGAAATGSSTRDAHAHMHTHAHCTRDAKKGVTLMGNHESLMSFFVFVPLFSIFVFHLPLPLAPDKCGTRTKVA